MANDPQWLKKFYGKDYETLSPTVVFEGNYFAVVKVCRVASLGYKGIGYVLIRKRGAYNVSPYESLFEGLPSQGDLDRMKKRLHEKENEP